MYTNEESLTPRQQAVCASIIVVVFLAFCSVFVYAYWRGTQAQMKLAQAQAQAIGKQRLEYVEFRKQATRIARGNRGQASNIRFQEAEDTVPEWVIHKIPVIESGGIEPPTELITASTPSARWHVYPTGVVQVPTNADLGLYKLQCNAGYYVFEVVASKTKSKKIVKNAPSPKIPTSIRIAQFSTPEKTAH